MFVYAENCGMAGKQVRERDLKDFAGESGEVSADWLEVEATEAEAAWYEQHRGQFGRKVAATIREAISVPDRW